MTATKTAEQIAAQLGLTVDQVREVMASVGDLAVTASASGTVETYSVYSPERLAARRAERAAEQAALDKQVAANLARRAAQKIS